MPVLELNLHQTEEQFQTLERQKIAQNYTAFIHPYNAATAVENYTKEQERI